MLTPKCGLVVNSGLLGMEILAFAPSSGEHTIEVPVDPFSLRPDPRKGKKVYQTPLQAGRDTDFLFQLVFLRKETKTLHSSSVDEKRSRHPKTINIRNKF